MLTGIFPWKVQITLSVITFTGNVWFESSRQGGWWKSVAIETLMFVRSGTIDSAGKIKML